MYSDQGEQTKQPTSVQKKLHSQFDLLKLDNQRRTTPAKEAVAPDGPQEHERSELGSRHEAELPKGYAPIRDAIRALLGTETCSELPGSRESVATNSASSNPPRGMG